MNSTAKSPGASCGTGQVCSAAGTCIPCANGASCTTNPANPCKKGAIACGTGAPQCLDDMNAPDGIFCGIDKTCKSGACMACAAGTVCTTNPGGACKLGVVACASASAGCVDGESVSAGNGLRLEHGVQRQRAVRDVRGGQGLRHESRRSVQDRRHRLHDGRAALPRRRQHGLRNDLRNEPGVQRHRHLRAVHGGYRLHRQSVDLSGWRHVVRDRHFDVRRRRAQAGVGDLPRRPDVRWQWLLRRLRRQSDLHR